MSEFDGRVALVTGAAGVDIGQAIARRLAAGGARVVVTDRSERRTKLVANQMAEDYPETTVVGYCMDVGDRDQIQAVIAEVTQTLGPVQILVNNAVHNVLGSIFDYDPSAWDKCVRVNLTGPWNMCRYTMPGMRDAGGGVIVNISSYAPDVGGVVPGTAIESTYGITKGGLNTMTRSFAQEGGEYNIRTVTVSMGLIEDTVFAQQHPELLARIDVRGILGSMPSKAEIADAVAFLASDRAAHVTGESLNIAAGAYLRP